MNEEYIKDGKMYFLLDRKNNNKCYCIPESQSDGGTLESPVFVCHLYLLQYCGGGIFFFHLLIYIDS